MNGFNYTEFKHSCQLALVVANAWSIVNGSEARPERSPATWEERRRKAVMLIGSSLEETIQGKVLPFSLAEDVVGMWKEIAKSDRLQDPIYQDRRLDLFNKEVWSSTETLRAYTMRLERYKIELQDTDNAITDRMMVKKLLHSLPETSRWDQAKNYCIKENLDYSSAFTHLLSFETTEPTTTTVEKVALASSSFRGRGNGRGRGRGRGSGYRGGRGGGGRRGVFKDGIDCFFCKKKGHKQADCHSYKKYSARAQKGDLKEEQHVNIVRIPAIEEDYSSCSLVPDSIESAHKVTFPTTNTAREGWVVDSGASRHFSGYKDDFKSIKRWSSPRTVRVANGGSFEAVGTGEVQIKTTKGELILEGVWYAPGFPNRLVSTGILNDGGVEVIFKKRRMRALREQDMKLLFEGTGKKGLCYIDQPEEAAYFTGESAGPLQEVGGDRMAYQGERSVNSTGTVSTAMIETWKLWHMRSGHLSYKRLLKLLKNKGVSFPVPKASEQLPGDDACEGCCAGKMKESFNKSTDSRAVLPGLRLHADLSGIKAPSIRGYRYFLLVIDDATRYCWIAFVKEKTAALCVPEFKKIKALIERERGQKVEIVRSDNGTGEFGHMYQDYLSDEGIHFEPSPPYKQSMNGAIERAMQEINKLIRTFLYEAKASTILWDLAAEHAVYLRNLSPTIALPWGPWECDSPYEAYHQRTPDSTNWKRWGCKAYPLNSLNRLPSTYDPRIRPAEYAFIGIQGSKIWRLLNMRTHKEERYGDVQFKEYEFHDMSFANEFTSIQRSPFVTAPEFRPEKILPPAEKMTSELPQEQLKENKELKDTLGEARTPGKSSHSSCSRSSRSSRVDNVETPTKSNGGSSSRSSRSSRVDDIETPVKSNGGSSSRSSRLSQSKRGVVDSEAVGLRVAAGSVNPSIFKPTRSGRVPKRTVFSDSVVQLVSAMKVVHINEEESASLGVPAPPFEAVTIEEAMKEDAPNWIKALDEELRSLQNSGTYAIVNIPVTRKTIRSKWVLRKKFNSEGALARYKARVVVKGFEQIYGLDYFKTFASVARFNTLRILLAKAAQEDLEIDQMDVDTAFLNAKLKEEIYMEFPDYFERIEPNINRTKQCLRLLKSLYGLKQAPREWYLEVVNYFKSIGFEPSLADPNLFVRDSVYILLYVDDMLFVGDRRGVDKAKAEVSVRWNSKDLGEAKLFVGFQIRRNRSAKSLQIHQTLYATKLIERFGLQNANPVSLPIPAGTVLKQNDLAEEEEMAGNPDYRKLDHDEVVVYRQAVGSLLYLANSTRFDICYAVGQLARFMQQPRDLHLRFVKQTLRYLRGTATAYIEYKSEPEIFKYTCNNLYTMYSDATWGTESDSISFQGWFVNRAGGAVIWSAQRQKSTSLSSMEAEFISASEASKEAAWLEKLNLDIDRSNTTSPTLWCDNQPAITAIHDPAHHNKLKHVAIRYNFVRNDMVQKERLEVRHIPGKDQPADILTKQLGAPMFKQHCHNVGLRLKETI